MRLGRMVEIVLLTWTPCRARKSHEGHRHQMRLPRHGREMAAKAGLPLRLVKKPLEESITHTISVALGLASWSRRGLGRVLRADD
jgi:hypothetical protein